LKRQRLKVWPPIVMRGAGACELAEGGDGEERGQVRAGRGVSGRGTRGRAGGSPSCARDAGMTRLRTLRCAVMCHVNGRCFLSRKETPTKAEERRIFGGDLESGVFVGKRKVLGSETDAHLRAMCARKREARVPSPMNQAAPSLRPPRRPSAPVQIACLATTTRRSRLCDIEGLRVGKP